MSGAAFADTEAREAPRPIHHIRALFEALRAAHPVTRLEALKAIQARPGVALAFGVFEGLDVIDVLIQESEQAAGTREWLHWLGTLDCFNDPRVAKLFLDLLTSADEPVVLFAAARHLGRMAPAALPQQRLEQAFLANENPVRPRAIRGLLEAKRVSIAAQVRMSLLSEDAPVPTVEQCTASIWLHELEGPFQLEARGALRTQGEAAWVALARLCDELGRDARVWLIQWGLEEFPGMVAGVLPQAMQGSESEVILEAVRTMGELSSVPEAVRALAIPFLRDPDSRIRQAAVAVGAPGVNWRELLDCELDPAVRRSLYVQLARAEGKRSVPDLVCLLRSQEWQSRTAAADCLVSLGQEAVAAVRPLVQDADPNVRAAAVRVLLDLRQDAWLEDLVRSGVRAGVD